MKKFSVLVLSMAISSGLFAQKNAGFFEAEGQKIDTRFVRVLFAGEGSEDEGGSNDLSQLVFDSKDPKGKAVKVVRFQILTKNTGYDEVQTSKEQDFKLKEVQNGVKLHIEVPVENGQIQLSKAYVGSLAYNFGTRETRNLLKATDVSDIKLNLKRLDLPKFTANHKPGDKGIIYNDGYVSLTLSSKAKHINSETVSPFNVNIDGVISITHIRGKERSDRAVTIDPALVAKNI